MFPLYFCGDFNSAPENGVFRFFTSQHIDSDDPDWTSKPGEEVSEVTFSHDLEIGSACGTPEFTNFTTGFYGCLDYIFYQANKFEVEQVVPVPTLEEVTEHVALPSVTIPSDHLALVADLKWKT
ncbi:2',5'-phosphodiesterase 12 [Armadillidium nasatum]|uniref:2',5'-phosphodiesterase 12 n=1 Tax=Armadillidium nasatum TaxID=96803 RepID=A0A5N5T8Y7_9CRUS|nr:2',5'-phosphodiesterase 12 [Armadillidium nasatum]